jgi:hypothetical protein
MSWLKEENNMDILLTPANERKWQLFVNGLLMSGHYTYVGARKAADRFQTGVVEIKTIVVNAPVKLP